MASCSETLQYPEVKCLNNTLIDVVDSFNKLHLAPNADVLLTDDEDDQNDYITDDEDSFTSGNVYCRSLELTSLYHPANENLTLSELNEKSIQLKLNLTQSDAIQIERLTRNQANSSHWHTLRKGRITASIFKSVCVTKIEKPSISLLTKICYPEKAVFTSKYTEWGRKNEKHALKEFIANMQARHINFRNSDSGLVILPEYPYFGASPDGLCSCDCCGKGCIEIKCPYTLKDGESLDLLLKKANPFLTKDNEKYDINKQHLYYFQIQMQLFLTKSNYCYFVVWSPKTLLKIKVLPDKQFWLTYSAKAENFFKSVILPELLAKHFTKTQFVKKHGNELKGN